MARTKIWQLLKWRGLNKQNDGAGPPAPPRRPGFGPLKRDHRFPCCGSRDDAVGDPPNSSPTRPLARGHSVSQAPTSPSTVTTADGTNAVWERGFSVMGPWWWPTQSTAQRGQCAAPQVLQPNAQAHTTRLTTTPSTSPSTPTTMAWRNRVTPTDPK